MRTGVLRKKGAGKTGICFENHCNYLPTYDYCNRDGNGIVNIHGHLFRPFALLTTCVVACVELVRVCSDALWSLVETARGGYVFMSGPRGSSLKGCGLGADSEKIVRCGD